MSGLHCIKHIKKKKNQSPVTTCIKPKSLTSGIIQLPSNSLLDLVLGLHGKVLVAVGATEVASVRSC